jgi:hypothetical protein
MLIDHADTGERRPVGPFIARHVVTTSTVEGGPDSVTQQSVRTQDGWYIDVPSADCDSSHARGYLAVLSAGERLHITTHGAPIGLAIDETDRETSAAASSERITRLIEISEQSIDPALFTVPDDYQPALRLPIGGFDMTKPDTWHNRADAYWQYASNWFRQLLR